jgi:CRISPR-associated protein Csb2
MPPTLSLLRLTSEGRDDAPPLERALPWLDGLHRAVVATLDGRLAEATELTGRGVDGEVLTGHRHVHWLPRADAAGLVRRVVAWAPGGFGAVALEVLARRLRVYLGPEKPVLVVEPELVGHGVDRVLRVGDAALSMAGRWVSAHPYLLGRHPKATRDSLEDQVRRELAQRGFPEPRTVESAVWGEGDWVVRRGHDERPPASYPLRVTVTFGMAVAGPICLGHGSHFGLGLFEPEG